MITKYHIECLQLIIIVGYLVFALVKRNQQPLTIKIFLWSGVLLAVDVFWFQCQRPFTIWAVFNMIEIIGVTIFIYEKIIRKSVHRLVWEVAVLVAMLFD